MQPLKSCCDSRVALVALLLSAPVQAGVLPDDTAVKTLESGLTVIALPLSTPDLVAVQIWMDAGSRHELEPGSTGYAHFAEHLLFRGSENFSAEEREQRLLTLGVIDNAWTSSDHTCYHLQLRADRLESVLELEADRFLRLQLTEDAVRRESGAVAGEHRKGLSDPESALYKALLATAFETHTYHHTTIGLDEDVAGMAEGLSTIETFLDTWYRPDTTTVVIAGDIDPAAAVASVEGAFGGWQAPDRALPVLPVEAPQAAERRAVVPWAGGPTPGRLGIAWKSPAFAPERTDAAAWMLVHSLLTERASSLYRRLIEGEDAAAWSMWSLSPDSVDPGVLGLVLELREGVDPAAVEAVVYAEVAALADITDEALEAAQQRLRRQTLLSLDSPRRWASMVGWYAVIGDDVAAIDAHLAALQSVTTEDIRRLVSEHLVETQRTVVVMEEAL